MLRLVVLAVSPSHQFESPVTSFLASLLRPPAAFLSQDHRRPTLWNIWLHCEPMVVWHNRYIDDHYCLRFKELRPLFNMKVCGSCSQDKRLTESILPI